MKIHFKVLCFYTALVFNEKICNNFEKAYDITKNPFMYVNTALLLNAVKVMLRPLQLKNDL